MSAMHGKHGAVHFSPGHVNDIPVPLCGEFIGGVAVRYSNDLARVSCHNCRRTLIACGIDIEQRYRPPQVDAGDDVLIYSLPPFSRNGLHE